MAPSGAYYLQGNQQDGKSEVAAEEPASAVEPGSAEDAEAAAKEILEADTPAQSDAGAAINHKQTGPATAEEKAPDTESHKTRSKGQVAPEAVGTAQEASLDAEAGKAKAETPAASGPAEGGKSGKQPEPETQLGTTSSSEEVSAAATEAMQAPVLQSRSPTGEAAASANDDAAQKAPSPVQTATGDPDAATAQPDALKPKQLAPSGAAAMDIDSEQPSEAPFEASNKQTAAAADQQADTAADTAAADAVPLVAALADAGMGDAATGEDAEMVQYDAQSDEEQAAPVKAQTQVKSADAKMTDAKVRKDDKSRRNDPPSTSKAVGRESASNASARKRGREGDEAARDDRKAPRTERRTDVKVSQREKDKEREREKDMAKDAKQTDGEPSSGTYRVDTSCESKLVCGGSMPRRADISNCSPVKRTILHSDLKYAQEPFSSTLCFFQHWDDVQQHAAEAPFTWNMPMRSKKRNLVTCIAVSHALGCHPNEVKGA